MRHPPLPSLALLLLSAGVGFGAGAGARVGASAATPDADARLRGAAAAETRLAADRVAAAARLQGTEAALADRAAAIATLAERRDATAARLAERAAAIAPLLPLMQRLALFPAETVLAIPARPSDTLRGLLVLRGIAARLETEGAALRAEQHELSAQTRAVTDGMAALQTLAAEQADGARALDAQIAAARAERDNAEDAVALDAARRAAAEAARAETLRAAVATAEAARARAEARAREDAARADRNRQDAAAAEARRREAVLARPTAPAPTQGGWSAPVVGTVVRPWGAATDAGPATGISVRAAPAARVVAPCGGRVRFAGPFRSYGELLILDCGGGYAVVLAGLDRLDVAAGNAILPGEPVGVMPAWNPAAGGSRPALYVELRRDGQAVDPAPFLKVRG